MCLVLGLNHFCDQVIALLHLTKHTLTGEHDKTVWLNCDTSEDDMKGIRGWI